MGRGIVCLARFRGSRTEAAERDGVTLRIVSGFRTMAEQERLYHCYCTCSCNGCNLAARPGRSNQQSGHALDLNTRAAGVLTRARSGTTPAFLWQLEGDLVDKTVAARPWTPLGEAVESLLR